MASSVTVAATGSASSTTICPAPVLQKSSSSSLSSQSRLWRPFSIPPRCLYVSGSRKILPISLKAQAEDSSSSISSPSPSSTAASATLEVSEENSSATGANADSVVSQVAALEEEPETPGVAAKANGSASGGKKPSPLRRGGTLSGKEAAGKDPGLAALGRSSGLVSFDGPFSDPRWNNGTWDLKQFTRDGKVDWDAVIDAEVVRRKWLEENPESSRNDEPVVFDTSIIPWWAWVKRFHLPEAELLNGRAAMIGFVAGYFIDSLTGAGLVDQTSNFFGKLFLFASVLGVLFIRKNEDLETLKQLVKEWNFYDQQWQASWQDENSAESKNLE